MNLLSTGRGLLIQMRGFLLLIFLAGAVFLIGGCGKKSSPAEMTADGQNNSSAPDQIPANSPAHAVESGPVVPVSVAESADASAQLAQLTQVLRRFGVERRRVPQSLNEVVAAGYLAALPAAPAGKRFAIDGKRMQVVLENK